MSCLELLYIVIAGGFCVYYGYRGVLIEKNAVERYDVDRHNTALKLKSDITKTNHEAGVKENPDAKEYPEWKEPACTHYIQGFILHFVSGAAGFLALYTLYNIYFKTEGLSNISTGTGAAVIFLSLLSIIGISGELPYVIKFGKFPSGK